MSAPSWQRPPRVLLLLSTLARDVCALVATTASRAVIIINARPDECALAAKTPSRAHIIINARPGLLRPSGTAQTASHAKSSWPGPFTRPPVKIVRFPCCALASRMAFTSSSTSSTKQKARLRCLRLRGKTTFSRAVLILHLSLSTVHQTIDNRSLACDVRALIAQPHVYVCMFN